MKKLLFIIASIILISCEKSCPQSGGLGFWNENSTCQNGWKDWTLGGISPGELYFDFNGHLRIGAGYGPYPSSILSTGIWTAMNGGISNPTNPYAQLKPGLAYGIIGVKDGIYAMGGMVPYPKRYFFNYALGEHPISTTYTSLINAASTDMCTPTITNLAIPQKIANHTPKIRHYRFDSLNDIFISYYTQQHYQSEYYKIFKAEGDVFTELGAIPKNSENEGRWVSSIDWYPNDNGDVTYAIVHYHAGTGFAYGLLGVYRIDDSGVYSMLSPYDVQESRSRSGNGFRIEVAGWDGSGTFHAHVWYKESSGQSGTWRVLKITTDFDGLHMYTNHSNRGSYSQYAGSQYPWIYDSNTSKMYAIDPSNSKTAISKYDPYSPGISPTRIN